MKTNFQVSALVGIISVVFLISLSSFSLKRGGDSYTISVNGEQVIRYFVLSKEKLPSLSLNSNSQEKISVYYNECGKIGTSRKLSIRDEKGSVLKEWGFTNALDEHTPMTVNTDDIVAKGNIGLYYTSDEVKTPRRLVNLVISKAASASR